MAGQSTEEAADGIAPEIGSPRWQIRLGNSHYEQQPTANEESEMHPPVITLIGEQKEIPAERWLTRHGGQRVRTTPPYSKLTIHSRSSRSQISKRWRSIKR